MNARPFQLSQRHRWVVYLVFGVLFASGFTWWLADEAQEDQATPVEWAEVAKPWLLRIHGAAALTFLVVLGTVLVAHAQRAWAARVNHRTGLWLGGWFTLQAITGYGLFYFGGETLRDWAGTVHVTLGLLAPLVLGGHVIRGKILSRRVHSSRIPSPDGPKIAGGSN